MSGAARWGTLLTTALALAGVAAWWSSQRRPEQIVSLRIERASAPHRDPHATLTYIAHDGIPGVTRPLFEGPRSPPVTWTTTLAATLDGDTLSLEVPLHQASLRDEHLRELRVDGLVFLFDPQGLLAGDATGAVHVERHASDEGEVDLDVDGLRSIEVRVDGSTRHAVTIPMPELPDEGAIHRAEIDGEPTVVMARNAERGFAFAVAPDAERSCVRAVLLEPYDVPEGASVGLDRAAWEQLASRDLTLQPAYGGTPTLTLDPAGSVWLHVSPGGSLGEVQRSELVIAIGCFPPGAPRGDVGLLRIRVE